MKLSCSRTALLWLAAFDASATSGVIAGIGGTGDGCWGF
jgi:hypothetical protein